MDEAGTLDGEPEISTVGLYEPREEDEDFPELETAIRDALHRLGPRDRKDDAAVEEAAGQAVRRTVNRLLGKKPITMVPVIRLQWTSLAKRGGAHDRKAEPHDLSPPRPVAGPLCQPPPAPHTNHT